MVDRPDVEAPRGVEPTGTNSRTATPHNHPLQGGKNKRKHHSDDRETPCTSHGSFLQSRPLSGPQPTTQTPAGTRASVARGMVNRRFAAAMAQGRRPDPFRTRKLRPGTAMVLHPEGCGRVARRRTQTSQGGDTTSVPPPFFAYPGHDRKPPPTPEHGTNRPSRTREANPIPTHTRHVDTWRIPYPDTRPRRAGKQNRTYDTRQDCPRLLLNMPASSFLSVFKRQRLFFGNLNRLLNLCSESL